MSKAASSASGGRSGIRFSRTSALEEYPERHQRAKNGTWWGSWMVEQMEPGKWAVQRYTSENAHIVDLEAVGEDELSGSCTCPDHKFRESVCIHLWAVLLEDEEIPGETADVAADGGVAAAQPGDTGPSLDSPRKNGGAPTLGELVEQWVADRFPVDLVDGKFLDGRLDDGTPVQIKGTQRRVKNGYRNGEQQYTAGRLTLWSEELAHLLADDGKYVVAVYDPDEDPESDSFVTSIRWLTAEEMGEVAAGSWTDAHRESKGKKGRVRWPRVLSEEERDV